MSLKSKLEAIIYAAEEPVTVDQIVDVLKDVAPEELAPPAAETQAETPCAQEMPGTEAEPTSSLAGESTAPADPKAAAKAERAAYRARVRAAIEELVAEYNAPDRGIEIRAIAGGYRMATK